MSLESPLCFSNRLRLTCLIGGANLRRLIAESLQPALNLKTMAANSAFQLLSQFYPSMPEARHATAKRTRRCARICRIISSLFSGLTQERGRLSHRKYWNTLATALRTWFFEKSWLLRK
jgi:hypothetical protein